MHVAEFRETILYNILWSVSHAVLNDQKKIYDEYLQIMIYFLLFPFFRINTEIVT